MLANQTDAATIEDTMNLQVCHNTTIMINIVTTCRIVLQYLIKLLLYELLIVIFNHDYTISSIFFFCRKPETIPMCGLSKTISIYQPFFPDKIRQLNISM